MAETVEPTNGASVERLREWQVLNAPFHDPVRGMRTERADDDVLTDAGLASYVPGENALRKAQERRLEVEREIELALADV